MEEAEEVAVGEVAEEVVSMVEAEAEAEAEEVEVEAVVVVAAAKGVIGHAPTQSMSC